MTDRELMQQALEALQAYGAHTPNCDYLMLLTSLPPQRKPCSCGFVAAITALEQRLAQPERKPVAWLPSDPPPECTSEAEKTAFAFGWFKALEEQRVAQPEQEPVIDKLGYVPPSDTSQERVAETEKQRHEQEPTVKHMMEWVEYLKRQSDHGQHLHIPSGMSAGTCWELAIELEQFVSTAPQRREWVGLTDEEIMEPWPFENRVAFARWLEAKLKEKNP